MADKTIPNPMPPPLRKRRFAIGLNVLVQIVAALALVVMANWLVTRHYSRFDVTKSGYYRLSEKTRQVLANLKEPVQAIVYLPPRASSDSGEKILEDIRHQLQEFEYIAKGKLRVEYVDPDRDRKRAEDLAEKYKFDEPNVVIFVCGARHKFVTIRDVVDFDIDRTGMEAPHVKAFKGEGVFLSALQTVTEEQPPTIYFLAGHGERDPESFEPRDGYATLATYIKRDNISVQKWNLQEQQAMPTNAAAIVIAGPRKRLGEVELNALDSYLKNRGRLLVLLDAHTQTGLETVLKRWGVQVDDDLVMRRAGALLGTELLDVNAVAIDYSPHPVTAKLKDTNTEFPYARSIRHAPQTESATADLPRVTELLKTASTYWGETDPGSERSEFDADKDLPGPLPLAVAVETGQPRDVDMDLGVTRMIVAGSSGFADNSSLTGGNLDFFMSALNWLLKRDQMLAVGPKTPQEFRLDMTLQQLRAVYALVIVGLPLAVGVIGTVVWLRRRK